MDNDKCNISKESVIGKLNQALETEKKSLILSSELSKLVRVDAHKAMLQGIAQDEKRHVNMVMKLIEIVEKHYR